MDVKFAESKTWCKSRTAGADSGFMERGFICIRACEKFLLLIVFNFS